MRCLEGDRELLTAVVERVLHPLHARDVDEGENEAAADVAFPAIGAHAHEELRPLFVDDLLLERAATGAHGREFVEEGVALEPT
jgi:hypothetical protein